MQDIDTSLGMASKQGAATGTGELALPGPRGAVLPTDRWLVRLLLKMLGNPPVQVTLWNGERVSTSEAPPIAEVSMQTRGALLRVAANPSLYFGDEYSAGRIEVKGNLVGFLETVYRATRDVIPFGSLGRQVWHWLNRPRANTLSGSRKNIHQHYDIGNDFYQLWLDKELVYTCAYFPDPSLTLEQAQVAKMDHVCRKLQLKPDERVVEAGCGWGSLALHMVRHYGVKVRSFNISHQQILYARERAHVEGLAHRVEFVEDDYRNISGQYDAFVSVGMLEHVGKSHYEELGEVIHRSLAPTGRGLIHSIGRNKPSPMNGWIEKRIFPGAHPPSLREMMAIFEPREFSVLDVENLRLHYAKTLEHWLARYEQVEDQVAHMFDPNFVQAWRLYLAGSIAAFTQGSLQLFQIVFARPTDNQIPWTRAHLYTEDQP
jgi:cyclopropane-fatty-acyl-phospholipid synthase